MSDLVVRAVELIEHGDGGPGVYQRGDGTAHVTRAPPAGSAGELHLHRQAVVGQRDGDRRRAEGCGWERESRSYYSYFQTVYLHLCQQVEKCKISYCIFGSSYNSRDNH